MTMLGLALAITAAAVAFAAGWTAAALWERHMIRAHPWWPA